MIKMPVKGRSALAWGGGIAAVIILGLGSIIVYGYATKPSWVRVADKTLWDWLQLLVVPAVLAGGLDAGRRPKRVEELVEHRFALSLDVDADPKDLLVHQQIQIIAALLSAR